MSNSAAQVIVEPEFIWPPNYVDIFAERQKRLKILESNPKMLQAAILHYRHNYADFINDWFMTYDPRDLNCPHKPFILFPKQRDFVQWVVDRIQNQEDGLAEKSRDAGLTFICGAVSICHFMFYEGQKISFGSRKESLVDELGNPDSIFEKIRYMISNIPPLLRPDVSDNFMKIANKNNGSTITGEAGDNIGRGGRSSVYFKDESAFYDRPERIEAALSANSNVKIDISTPNGGGNPFYQKRFGGKIPVFTYHWKDDPRKDDAWYAKQCENLDPVVVAQEIDIDYDASIENICIDPMWVKACIDFPMEARGDKVRGYDPGAGGDANATVDREGSVITMEDIQQWGVNDKATPVAQHTRKVYAQCRDKKIHNLNYDSIGIGEAVRGEIDNLQRTMTVQINCTSINVAESSPSGMWDEEHTIPEMFVNLKAYLWWIARRKCQRTWERKMGFKDWPDEECISIPNHPQLIAELSQPKTEPRASGKYEIESKKALKKRGIKSPNIAEAFVMCLAPIGMNDVGVW